MGGIILACLTALYALLFLFLGPKATPSVSVVIPMRNEEEFAERTLEAVAAQDYIGEWEVICVDDRSTDRTREILEKFAATHPRFRVLSLPQDLPQIASPKKRALESAFKIAKNEVLLTMDADCIPRKSWITAMAGRFVDGICIVQGPKQNNGSRSMPHLYQKLETLGYTAMEAAGFSLGRPIVASAACLAYKKDLFFKVGGFGAHQPLERRRRHAHPQDDENSGNEGLLQSRQGCSDRDRPGAHVEAALQPARPLEQQRHKLRK